MRKTYIVLVLALLAAAPLGVAGAQQLAETEGRTLRARIEQRYDVVPLSDGIALRPKTRTGDVRLIEVSDTIAINGAQVTGRELRDRLGTDADAILRLSYLNPAARLALFAEPPAAATRPDRDPAVEAERGPGTERKEPVERYDQPARETERRSRGRRVSRDTVRILGNVNVAEDEELGGQAVAVIGSVRVDGHVRNDVVAVLGSVDLGPNAVVRGNVVAVGGRIRRAPGSQIHGDVTEISLGDHRISVAPWLGPSIPFYFLDGVSAVPRLFGSIFRFVLLALLASMALVLARRTVEASAQRVRENPVQAVLVGLAAGILLVPVIFLTSVILAISIIGIPLLLLLPFAVLALCLIALAGFSGTAYTVGQWARRRFGTAAPTPVIDVCVGVLVILLPVLLARVIALAGWPMNPVSWLLLATGVGVEIVAWSGGFGAVLTNAFTRWQMTRASRLTPPPATA